MMPFVKLEKKFTAEGWKTVRTVLNVDDFLGEVEEDSSVDSLSAAGGVISLRWETVAERGSSSIASVETVSVEDILTTRREFFKNAEHN